MIVELVEHSRYHSVLILVQIFYQKNPALRSLPSISILATPHPSYRARARRHQPLQPLVQGDRPHRGGGSPRRISTPQRRRITKEDIDPTEKKARQGGDRTERLSSVTHNVFSKLTLFTIFCISFSYGIYGFSMVASVHGRCDSPCFFHSYVHPWQHRCSRRPEIKFDNGKGFKFLDPFLPPSITWNTL